MYYNCKRILRYVIKEFDLSSATAVNLMAEVESRSEDDLISLVIVLGNLIIQNPEYELPAIEFINETFSEPKEVKMLVQAYSMLRE
jgi:hypothetical protein